MWLVVVLVPAAWLLGTFPSAQLIARAHGHDVLTEGSGNPGASNVARLAGWRAGAAVLVLDFAKGALAAGVGMAVYGRVGAYALGIAAVVGHTFPVYRKGGKGVAAAGGMLVVLYPLIVVGLAIVWALLARVAKKASLASLLCTVAFPVAVGLMGYDGREVVAISALAVLVLARHAANIRRLLRREEIDLKT
ncbi:MAG: acyl-phosphate glycerol 3-phosphate acyltransferase [Actinomycetia bacterium]|jgi:glycerol-3-phosphate acyltransferase PlsY|nr:acyl-phosphate glycerol 3-phosphate acyltransferase [Actinomycetes bacterium]